MNASVDSSVTEVASAGYDVDDEDNFQPAFAIVNDVDADISPLQKHVITNRSSIRNGILSSTAELLKDMPHVLSGWL